MKREGAQIDTLQDARLRKSSRMFQDALATFYDIDIEKKARRGSPRPESWWEAERYLHEHKNLLGELLTAGGEHFETALKLLNTIVSQTWHTSYIEEIGVSAYKTIFDHLELFAHALTKKSTPSSKEGTYALLALTVHSEYIKRGEGYWNIEKLKNFLEKNTIPLLNDFVKTPSKHQIDLIEFIKKDSWNEQRQAIIEKLRFALEKAPEKSSRQLLFILGYCAASRDVEISSIGKDAIKKLLASYTIDGEALLHAWYQGETRKSMGEYIAHNLHIIMALEKKERSSALVLLKEFGIHHFARYPFEVLLRQYLSREDHSKPYGVALMPIYDESGAFTERHDLWVSIDNQLRALGYRLRISEINSRAGLLKRLITNDRRYGDDHKVSFMLLGAHGYANAIQPGGHNQKDIETSDLQRFSKNKKKYKPSGAVRSRMFFTNHAPVTLWSCSAGKEGGVAQKLSKILNTEVSAPIDISLLERLKISLKNGVIHLVPEYASYDESEVKRMTYRSGKRIIEEKEDRPVPINNEDDFALAS